jgi:hypothetical protein
MMKLKRELIDLLRYYPATTRFLKLKEKSEPAFRLYLEIRRKLQPTAQKTDYHPIFSAQNPRVRQC